MKSQQNHSGGAATSLPAPSQARRGVQRACVCVCAQQIKLAEVEQASLMSEQLSDKSSSLALPDDLSLDEHSNYQLLVRDSQVPPF